MRRTKLVEYRRNKSQAEMAKRYNVSQQSWSMWELGKTTPSLTNMKKLERDIGIPMETIFFDVFHNL